MASVRSQDDALVGYMFQRPEIQAGKVAEPAYGSKPWLGRERTALEQVGVVFHEFELEFCQGKLFIVNFMFGAVPLFSNIVVAKDHRINRSCRGLGLHCHTSLESSQLAADVEVRQCLCSADSVTLVVPAMHWVPCIVLRSAIEHFRCQLHGLGMPCCLPSQLHRHSLHFGRSLNSFSGVSVNTTLAGKYIIGTRNAQFRPRIICGILDAEKTC